MQDELKKVISQAMGTSSNSEQEPIAQFTGELSDETLEAVAGGVCIYATRASKLEPAWFGLAAVRNANKLV